MLPEAQLSAVDSLIDNMMLVEDDQKGNNWDLFKVHHIPNPAHQRLFQVLQHSWYWNYVKSMQNTRAREQCPECRYCGEVSVTDFTL